MATFWFVPMVIILSAVLLSFGLIYIDGIMTFSQDGLRRYFFVNSADSARTILSTISGAMIGVAGTVFSVTLVALTLASSQFGPRLIRNFMYVRLNQVVLGSYVSSYLYCLLIMNAIKEGSAYTFIPALSILFAILSAVVNIVLLIIFIHQIATSIQADKVISDISDFISVQVKTLFPERMGDEMLHDEAIDPGAARASYEQRMPVKSPRSGYLQYIDGEALMEIVTTNNLLLEIHRRPGTYLVEGIEIGVLYSRQEIDKVQLDKILQQFVIGKTKTAQQDLEFSIHQMVEIAVRALSPGVNDPYTAIACIDNLSATMCYLTSVQFPSKFRFDTENELRIIAKPLDFEGILNAAFNQIRQFSTGSTAVIIRLMEALTTIHDFAVVKEHKQAIIRHARMVMTLGEESIKEKNDIQDLVERSSLVLS